MQPDGDEFVPASDGAQPKTGEGGVHTFNFKADGSGEATLTFTYARSWEASDSEPKMTLEIRAKMMPMEFIVPRIVSP